MISKKLEKELNDQINAEFFSAYLYLSMAAYSSSINMNGAASWLEAQAQEELEHAMKFYKYIEERGGRVILKEIKEPAKEWKSLEDVFKAAYEHEKYISERINKLMELAVKEKDFATQSFLNWFVDEQVEEEASTLAVYEKLKMVRDYKGGLFMVDRELAQRSTFNENKNN